jgi:hypothetical protein
MAWILYSCRWNWVKNIMAHTYLALLMHDEVEMDRGSNSIKIFQSLWQYSLDSPIKLWIFLFRDNVFWSNQSLVPRTELISARWRLNLSCGSLISVKNYVFNFNHVLHECYWGFNRSSSSFWAWTTNQMRHLTEIRSEI